jgi:hypothetical protein
MPYSPSPVTTVGQGTSSAASGSKLQSTVESKTKQETSFVQRLSKISFLSHIKNNLQGDFNKSSTSDKAKNGKFPPVDEEDPDSKNGEHSVMLKNGKDGVNGPDEKKLSRTIKDAKEIKERPKWKVATEKVLNGWYWQIFMMIITLYCLFGDDLRQAVFPMGADTYFYTLTSASLVLFSIEIVISSIVIEGYWLGFFFWLDVIATVSLIFDIGWIMDLILGVGTGATGSGSNV